MYKETLGIIGGFGAYATLDFYKRFLEKFESDCERNYPHIYMDNNYTMPSRTRALLYGDDYDEIVEKICKSVQCMLDSGVDYIVMVCGTAHAFLSDIYKKIPEANGKIINIIDCLKKELNKNQVKRIFLVAAEGTLKKKVYQSWLGDIECVCPSEKFYHDIRLFIEAVKQNRIDNTIAEKWYVFLEKFGCTNIILGCTELPVLVKSIEKNYKYIYCKYDLKFKYFDPLESVLSELKAIMK